MTTEVLEENLYDYLMVVAKERKDIERRMFNAQRKWNLSFNETATLCLIVKNFNIIRDPYFENFERDLRKIFKRKNL